MKDLANVTGLTPVEIRKTLRKVIPGGAHGGMYHWNEKDTKFQEIVTLLNAQKEQAEQEDLNAGAQEIPSVEQEL